MTWAYVTSQVGGLIGNRFALGNPSMIKPQSNTMNTGPFHDLPTTYHWHQPITRDNCQGCKAIAVLDFAASNLEMGSIGRVTHHYG
ncbi:hypothetical protein JTE90_012801 [Oedothorax gibbosus]|uniref:Uncharacterized protein n=1 Tax=Oedothorax gibbosus TaxID=931172 RepID=A0AAV6W062_9ARAC|nr:hypothetical protein JTE90_012801 [Oedothorax gibbosus]